MAGVGKLMKQAAKMQKQMEALQNDLAAQFIEVSSGGGAITVKISLGQEMESIKIDPEFLKEEVSIIEETLLEGIKLAYTQSKEKSEGAMNQLAEAMRLPGMPSLF